MLRKRLVMVVMHMQWVAFWVMLGCLRVV